MPKRCDSEFDTFVVPEPVFIKTDDDVGHPQRDLGCSILQDNLQPVIPVKAGDWNLVSRLIIPFASVGGFTTGLPSFPSMPEGLDQETLISGAGGLGDFNYSLFVSPANPGRLIWGLGPSISFPTATDPLLGTEKWSAGPTAVALTRINNVTVGALTRQLWSFAGASDRSDVSQFMFQPFVNIPLRDG